ncbi:MAG: TetR family transcriptional regulator C-terminal domain-containing protein, partial [Desulfocucumaceae bacterium]
LTAIINKGIENGEFRPLDARASAEVFRTLFEGIIMRCHFHHKDVSLLRRIAKTAINIYLEGLLNK